MKFARYIGLFILLIFNQSLVSCQKEVTSVTVCPDRPQATLQIDRVQEIQLSSTPTTRSGNSSALQPIGYKFAGTKGQVIRYSIEKQALCTWLYDPDNQIIKDPTLPKDGIYLLQLAQANGTGTFAITMTLSPAPLPPAAEPSPSPVSTISTDPVKPKPQDSIEDNNLKPPPTKLKNQPPSKLTEQEARNLIEKWLEAKKSLFGITHDKSAVEKITTGIAYKKYVKDESNNLTKEDKNLSNRTIYYTHEKQQVYKIVKIKTRNRTDRVMVRAIITEHRTRHDAKTEKTIKIISDRNIFCYEFTRVDGDWKISITPQLIQNKQACIRYKTADWDDRS